MNISCCFPAFIYIEDENVKEFLHKEFGANINFLHIGDWFETTNNFSKQNYYIVKPLDNFDKVAKRLNISIEELKSKVNTKSLFVGQKIYF